MLAIIGTGAAAAMLLGLYPAPSPDVAEAAVVASGRSSSPLSEAATLRAELMHTRNQLTQIQDELKRANGILHYTTQYRISPILARRVYDAAIDENVDPELAFRLVKLESDFNPRALSPAGAVGLTQLMPSTARFYQKDISRDQLFDADLNLHVGFRYLHSLVVEYHGVDMALLVYNRGELAVRAATAEGKDPTNGYDRILMKGYKGPGIID